MLENRNDLLEIKKAEIISIIERTNISLRGEEKISSRDIMQSLLKSGGLLITPPQQDPPMMHMLMIDSLSNYNKGESIKPGNVKLNIRHLIESLPNLTADTVEIAMDIPILKVCAALNIWKVLRDIITVEITKEQAIVVVALCDNCNQQQRKTKEKGEFLFWTVPVPQRKVPFLFRQPAETDVLLFRMRCWRKCVYISYGV